MAHSKRDVFATFSQLRTQYAVSEQSLLAYAARGNLAMRRVGSLVLFDEQGVRTLFPQRRPSGEVIAGALGVLGQARLGSGRSLS